MAVSQNVLRGRQHSARCTICVGRYGDLPPLHDEKVDPVTMERGVSIVVVIEVLVGFATAAAWGTPTKGRHPTSSRSRTRLSSAVPKRVDVRRASSGDHTTNQRSGTGTFRSLPNLTKRRLGSKEARLGGSIRLSRAETRPEVTPRRMAETCARKAARAEYWSARCGNDGHRGRMHRRVRLRRTVPERSVSWLD